MDPMAATSEGASVTRGVVRVAGCVATQLLVLLILPLSAESFSVSIVCPRSAEVGEFPVIDVTLSDSGIDGQLVRIITTMVGQGTVETLEELAVLGPIVAANISLPLATTINETVMVPTAVPSSYDEKVFSQIIVAAGSDRNRVHECLIAVPEPERHWQMLASLLTLIVLGQHVRGRSNSRSQIPETF